MLVAEVGQQHDVCSGTLIALETVLLFLLEILNAHLPPLRANPVDRQFAVRKLKEPDFDSLVRQICPDEMVGREFHGAEDDIVTGLPGEAIGDLREPVRGVLNVADPARIPIDQLGCQGPPTFIARKLDSAGPIAVPAIESPRFTFTPPATGWSSDRSSAAWS